MKKVLKEVARQTLINEAAALTSEHGENPEYDRALAELVYWTTGGESLEQVVREIARVRRHALRSRNVKKDGQWATPTEQANNRRAPGEKK